MTRDPIPDLPSAAMGLDPDDEPAEAGWVSDEVTLMAAAWARGDRLTAAEIIARHPDLESDDALRLIYEEKCLAREAGEDPGTVEMIGRYPRWADELRALFDCDKLISPPGEGAADLEIGQPLGPFLLLAELGRGASGRTFLATDPTLADRPVVVKVIPDDQEEHLALARLRHTHIVPLFSEHAFPERGLRGLCMPYLGGASLDQILKELSNIPQPLWSGRCLVEIIDRITPPTPGAPPADGPFRRSLEQSSYVQAFIWIASCLADALHYAHARGLVHMDMKPSNVLITVDGQPMLLDFHLARGPIAPGEWITDRLGGTPGWMSPEQEAAMDAVAKGKPAPMAVDGRTDIFALGLVLRESLRGLRPPAVSLGLEDIVRKCLAPDSKARYADAAALAEDLRRELNDMPLRHVRNRSPVERWRKWRLRHPGALAWSVTGVMFLLACGVAATAIWASYRQQVGQLTTALETGHAQRIAGRDDEAIQTLKRGLGRVGRLPGTDHLKASIDDELRLAQRSQIARELHDLADRIRYRYGVEFPSRPDAVTLTALCREIWARRSELTRAGGLDRGAEDRIRTDMLEVAVVWSDLLMHLAPPAEQAEARARALRLLHEARTSFGPSLAVEARERLLDPHGGEPASKALVARSSWEHYDLGRYELRSGRIAQAAEEFRRTLDDRPQDFWSNFYDGLCAYRLRHFDDAVAAFRACIALSPDSAICHYNRALAFEALGNSSAAAADYTRAIDLDPRLSAARLNRGILSYKSGRPREAIADFQAAIASGPDSQTMGRIYYNLSLAQLAQGERSAARESADAAIRLGNGDARPLREGLR